MRLTIDRPGAQMLETHPERRNPQTAARQGSASWKASSGFRYFRANTPAEIDRLLDAFLAAKSVHMAQQGLT